MIAAIWPPPLKKQSSRAVLHRQHRLMGVKSSMSGNIAMCSRRFLLNIEKPPAQGRGFFRRVGLHPPSRNGNLSCHVTRCGNECPLHPRTQYRRRIISAASSGVGAMSTGPLRLRSSRAPRGRARRMWGRIPHSQVTFSDVRDDGFVGLAECAIIRAQIEVGFLRFDARQQQRPAASGARRAKPIYEFVFRDVWHGSLELAGAQHSQSPIM
jgi:hypothetical protein